MASPLLSSLSQFSLLSKLKHHLFLSPIRPVSSSFQCHARTGFFNRLGRLVKYMSKSDVEKLFYGCFKTRYNLAIIDELLLYWNLTDTDRFLDGLEETLAFNMQTPVGDSTENKGDGKSLGPPLGDLKQGNFSFIFGKIPFTMHSKNSVMFELGRMNVVGCLCWQERF